MIAWINKQNRRAIAEMAEMLKTESQAKARAEIKLRKVVDSKALIKQKIKASTEQKLLTQKQRYRFQVDRIETQAKEEIAKVKAQLKERLERLNSYEAEFKEKEAKLSEAQEQLMTESIVKTKIFESLRIERHQLKEAKAKLNKETTKAKTLVELKLIESPGKTKNKTKPKEVINTIKPIHWYGYKPRNIKRRIALVAVLVIFSAITFALSVSNIPSWGEPASKTAGESLLKSEALTERDSRIDQSINNNTNRLFQGSLGVQVPRVTYTHVKKHDNDENVTKRGNDEKSTPDLYNQHIITKNPLQLKIITSTNNNNVQFSDNIQWKTNGGSCISYKFSEVSIPEDTTIKSVVLFIEHFEEEQFAEGKLEWSVGTGWPNKPIVWATINAPINEGETNETFDTWDFTSVVDTPEKINSLQLQVKNNNNLSKKKTLIDYAYVIVEYD